jgi:hypothetical protein
MKCSMFQSGEASYTTSGWSFGFRLFRGSRILLAANKEGSLVGWLFHCVVVSPALKQNGSRANLPNLHLGCLISDVTQSRNQGLAYYSCPRVVRLAISIIVLRVRHSMTRPFNVGQRSSLVVSPWSTGISGLTSDGRARSRTDDP